MERDALTGRRPVRITQANAYLVALEKQFYRASAEVRFERSRPESIRLMKRVAKMGGGAASADVQPPIDVVLAVARRRKQGFSGRQQEAAEAIAKLFSINEEILEISDYWLKATTLTDTTGARHRFMQLINRLQQEPALFALTGRETEKQIKQAQKEGLSEGMWRLRDLIESAAWEWLKLIPKERKRALQAAYAWLERQPRFMQATSYDRYPHFDALVIEHAMGGSKKFCDAGCSIPNGVLATISSKKRFSQFALDVDVHGVDVANRTDLKDFQKTALKQHGVKILVSDYRAHRLPANYDFIRVGNVSQYLDKQTFRRTFYNLVNSLNENGLLMVEDELKGRKAYVKRVKGNRVVLEEIDWKQSHGRLASDPRFNLGLTGKEKKDEPKSEFA